MENIPGKKNFQTKSAFCGKNPVNGLAIAALKDINWEIKLPNALPTYKENFEIFQSMWLELDYDLELLFENVRSHVENDETCCLNCNFPFSPICSELYSQFEPDPPKFLPPQYGFYIHLCIGKSLLVAYS